MKLILTGFMGSGKSKIGKILKEKIDIPIFDTDKLILEKSGFECVNDIFEFKGELYFRELEIQISKELTEIKQGLIITGGGVVQNKINLDYLKAHGGEVIFLNTNFATISKRLAGDKSRPLFQDPKKAKELFDFRLPLYEKYADKIYLNEDTFVTADLIWQEYFVVRD